MRALALALALVPSPAGASGVQDALAVGDLICEFTHTRSRVAELVLGSGGDAGLLLVFEAVTPQAAQVLSSEAPGRRPVLVRATRKAVHFIEQVDASVRMTSLTACEQRKLRAGTETCVRYTARYAWVFGARAVTDPDQAFAELPAGAPRGFCEPWQVR